MDRRGFLRTAALGAGATAFGWPTLGCAPSPSPLDPLGPGFGGLPSPTPGRDRFARVPSTFLRRVTSETDDVELDVLEGTVPEDLGGHVFVQSLSLLPDDAGFGGDSLLWRFDLGGGAVRATSRLLRTTDYLLGRAFAGTPYAFASHGVMRMGLLGIQDQANTALVHIGGNRLLATVDAGRPWEIDPATLRPVTPVGRLDDYRPMFELRDFDRFLCPMVITSAHPPYDARTGEYYGVALSTLPLPGAHHLDLLCWSGDGELRRVPVLSPELNPLLIDQSAHQICLCRDYVVIVDTSSNTEPGKLFSPPYSLEAGASVAPRPDTWAWIIDRREVRATTGAVVARKVVLPRATAHFSLDYDHPPGRVVLHDPHLPTTDFGEWLMPWDVHARTRAPLRPELTGAPGVVSFDLGVVARYEIDVASARVVDQSATAGDWTWGTGGLVTRNPLTPDDTVGDVFHAMGGFATDLAALRIALTYGEYPYRLVEWDDLPWDGLPTSLVRFDHDAGRVVDGYFFPGDRLGWSPTFVPRRGAATASADGYVVSIVFGEPEPGRSSGAEVWIFDAADLAAGPLARLGRSDLAFPLSLHTCWLDSVVVTRPDYGVDVAAELTERAATYVIDPDVAGILRSEVLPAWEAARA